MTMPIRSRPLIPYKTLTQAVPLPTLPVAVASPPAPSNVLPPTVSVDELTNFDPSQAVPSVRLIGTLNTKTEAWSVVQDLLGSGDLDPAFVVEVESDGTARFGFATPPYPGETSVTTNGLLPESGTEIVAYFRIGNGTGGNHCPEQLTHFD